MSRENKAQREARLAAEAGQNQNQNNNPNGDAPPAPSKQAMKAETGTDTVCVALKHPTGVVIEAFRQEKGQEPVLGGGFREVKVWRPTGKQYPVNGNRFPFGTVPSYKIENGYALTEGVPKDVWKAWLEQHQDHPCVEQRLIAAFDSEAQALAFARTKDNAVLRSGMEPLALKDDPRVDKKRTRSGEVVDAMSIADEQPKASAG